MTTKPFSILELLISLFDPPPLATMTQAQKLKRIVLFVAVLVVVSVLSSLLAAAGVYTFEHLYRWSKVLPELSGDLAIIFLGMIVNTICVAILFGVRRADRKLVSRLETSEAQGKESQT